MRYSRFIVERLQSQRRLRRSRVRSLIEELDLDRTGYIPEEDIIRVNVSGTIFETTRNTLAHYPNSLLGDNERLKQHWNDEVQAYYFDRDPDYFEEILSAYQQWPTAELQRQDNPVNIIRELAYFDMGPVLTQKVLESYNLTLVGQYRGNRSRLKQWCWNVLENGRTSRVARCFDILRRFVMLAGAIAASVTSYQQNHGQYNLIGKISSAVQTVCLTFILLDFIARLSACENIRQFFSSLYNIIDFVTVVIIATILLTLLFTVATAKNGLDAGIIRLLLVCETIQLYKFHRYNDFMAAMTITFKTHHSELLCMATLLLFASIMFGQCFILIEDSFSHRTYTNTEGIWWGVVTMATVGYGDIVPKSWQGKTLSVVWILVSKVLISMFIPIFAAIYKDFVDGLRTSREFGIIVNSVD